jgi:hypothetical protein
MCVYIYFNYIGSTLTQGLRRTWVEKYLRVCVRIRPFGGRAITGWFLNTDFVKPRLITSLSLGKKQGRRESRTSHFLDLINRDPVTGIPGPSN